MKKITICLMAGTLALCCAGCSKKEEETKETNSLTQTPSAEETQAAEETTDENKGIIEDQTFDVTLDDWQDVTFASFEPEDEEHDVEFKLLKDGKVVYTFPGMNEDNTRTGEQFQKVEAVSFQDYNEDGKKDVILILTYTSAGESYNEARVYLQQEDGQGFAMDDLLTEYLAQNYCNDSIDSVMDSREDYKEYQEGMDGTAGVDAQFALMAQNTDLWLKSVEYADDTYCYAVTDLDANGRLELIVSNSGGTGNYTYSSFYEINDSFDGLTECTTDFVEGDSQPDVIMDSVPAYDDNGVFHYIFSDYLKASVSEYYTNIIAITLQEGNITQKPLAYSSEIYGDSGEGVMTYQNAAEEEITEEEYQAIADSVYEGMPKYTATFGWQDIRELTSLSTDEIAAKLSESYEGFELVQE